MNTKTLKNFDAVAEGRLWKQAVGRELNARTRAEKRAYLREGVRQLYAGIAARQKKEVAHIAR